MTIGRKNASMATVSKSSTITTFKPKSSAATDSKLKSWVHVLQKLEQSRTDTHRRMHSSSKVESVKSSIKSGECPSPGGDWPGHLGSKPKRFSDFRKKSELSCKFSGKAQYGQIESDSEKSKTWSGREEENITEEKRVQNKMQRERKLLNSGTRG